ncbi:hypothetical protein LOTGIDRAFT_237470 [Lottia gigantea]|uniref:Glycosyltransferase family 92 protein n=1 Tax=Lottia gigantea TaxID=225164 RepID=V4B9N8_LOTGI|nr:hypothetical protein LOTGIDRAFT_237470 [Lottia gigantea]ESP04171.1 hypothetical protein LOTGIDRAFT_237470 [Lottia gigantea]
MPNNHRSRLMNIFTKYRDIFASSDTELGQTDTVKMKIDVGDHPPIKLRPYRTPLNKTKIVDKEIDDMLGAGIIAHSDPVLPLDNILKPRRKFLGEGDFHQIALENQHRSFLQVYKNVKKAKKRQAKYANKNTKNIEFKVGDPVYYKNFLRKNKLEDRWTPYYRIVEKTSSVSYRIKSQLTGKKTTKAHAEQLRLAKIDEWDIPTDEQRLRQAKKIWNWLNRVKTKCAVVIFLVIAYPMVKMLIKEGLFIADYHILKTTNLLKPIHPSAGFSPVGDTFASYVYSAYYDNRSTTAEIQITVLFTASPATYFFTCIVWDLDNKPIKLRGRLEYIPDFRKPRYSSGFVRCSLGGIQDRLTEISLIPTSTKYRYTNMTYPQNILTIKYADSHFKRNVTRCIQPMYNYTNRINIIQMIEYDRLMGTDHFDLYDYENNSALDILEYYKKKGIVEIHPWKLPIPSNSGEDVHHHAQYLHMHDCLMRNLHVSRYVLFADIDELVVSRKYHTWKEIVDDHKACDSLSFQNAFFFPGLTKELFPFKELAKTYDLNTFLWTNHSEFYSHGERSKVLVDPQQIWICKIHAVKYFVSSFNKECFLDPNDVFLHHYRPAVSDSVKYQNVDMLGRSERLIKNIVLVIRETNVDKN